MTNREIVIAYVKDALEYTQTGVWIWEKTEMEAEYGREIVIADLVDELWKLFGDFVLEDDGCTEELLDCNFFDSYCKYMYYPNDYDEWRKAMLDEYGIIEDDELTKEQWVMATQGYEDCQDYIKRLESEDK